MRTCKTGKSAIVTKCAPAGKNGRSATDDEQMRTCKNEKSFSCELLQIDWSTGEINRKARKEGESCVLHAALVE